ncbi:MAG: gamma-glutamylcyclotransferase [Alcanivoracaceae bacterium]
MQQRVFVYGTLLQGERNHHWMQGARLLGPARTAPRFRLWSLGSYPVLCFDGRQSIRGEVYQLSATHLRSLDILEECPRYYLRCRIPTRYGPAWIYYQPQPPQHARALPGGDWRRRVSRPLTRQGFAGVSAVQGRRLDLA